MHFCLISENVSNTLSVTKIDQFANVSAGLNCFLAQDQYADATKVAKRETENVFTPIPRPQKVHQYRVVKVKTQLHLLSKLALLRQSQKTTRTPNKTKSLRRLWMKMRRQKAIQGPRIFLYNRRAPLLPPQQLLQVVWQLCIPLLTSLPTSEKPTGHISRHSTSRASHSLLKISITLTTAYRLTRTSSSQKSCPTWLPVTNRY